MTAFVLDTVTTRAKGVIKQHRDLVLSNETFARFVAELDKPAEPVPELVELFQKNSELHDGCEPSGGPAGAPGAPTTISGPFESGNAALDDWLRRNAVPDQEMDSARTFVLTGDDHVVGYFSLTMGSVRHAEAPAKLVRGLSGYPVRMVLSPGSPSPVRTSPRASVRSWRRWPDPLRSVHP